MGTYCYIFSSRDCFKCVPEILVCCIFILVGFEELLYFCLHFIVYPVNVQEPVVQFSWSCAVLSSFLNFEFKLDCTIVWETVCYDFSCFAFAWWVIYFQLCGQFLSRCDVVLRRMYILWIWGGEFCKCLSGLLIPGLSSSLGYPC